MEGVVGPDAAGDDDEATVWDAEVGLYSSHQTLDMAALQQQLAVSAVDHQVGLALAQLAPQQVSRLLRGMMGTAYWKR
jgi:hypothetical protein